MNLDSLMRMAQEELAARQRRTAGGSFARYQADPVGYCRNILGVRLTDVQAEAMRLLTVYPYRVLLGSAHNCGKSFLMACTVCWRYDSFDPSASITLAPTYQHLVDVLWTEVRLLRGGARVPLDGFQGPKAPELRSGPDHFAKGMTANSGEAFAGRHRKCMFFGFDEATDIDPVYWQVADTMYRPEPGNAFLVIFNPTDPSTRAYFEEKARVGSLPNDRPKWHVLRMSAMDHPNVVAELRGEERPYPNAVTLEQFNGWVYDWCERRDVGQEPEAGDIEWPPGSGVWWEPGADMEARGLGRWPSGDAWGVWSDRLWQIAETPFEQRKPAGKVWVPDMTQFPVIGCDVAQRGFNYTTIHTRWGTASLAHERHHGWDSVKTAGRLIQRCNEMAALYNSLRPPTAAPISPKQIPVNVDGSGDFGVIAIGQHQGYNWRGFMAQSQAVLFDRYSSLRSELWFQVKERAKAGLLDLSRLHQVDLQRLHSQAIAIQWNLTAAGQRKVESKDEIRKPNRMGSEFLLDDMDGLNLAYYETGSTAPTAIGEKSPGLTPHTESGAARRGMMGLKPRGDV